MILRAKILKSIIERWVLGNLGDELHLVQESVKFQEELKNLLAEKYSFILYQRYYELKSSIWIIGILVLANLGDVAPLRGGICRVSGGIEWAAGWKIFFHLLSKILRAKTPNINHWKIGFRQSRRCASLRTGICGVSGGIESSAGWKIFFHLVSKILWAKILNTNHWNISFSQSQRCAILIIGR
jgi:hypothetical protein